jgi:hypothetical protein
VETEVPLLLLLLLPPMHPATPLDALVANSNQAISVCFALCCCRRNKLLLLLLLLPTFAASADALSCTNHSGN